MALQVTALQQSSFPGVDAGQFIDYLFFGVVAAGNYVTGGDVLNFSGASPLLTTGQPPVGPVTIQSQSAAAGHSGYQYYYRPGNPSTQSNGRMQVLTTGTGSGQPMVELAAGAYPVAITSDTIVGSAGFPRA